MKLVDRLLAPLLGPPRPAAPLMLRLVAPGGALPDAANVETRWAPSGRIELRTLIAAQGLVLLPWKRGERSVEIVVRAGAGVAHVRASADDGAGVVREILLIDEIAAE